MEGDGPGDLLSLALPTSLDVDGLVTFTQDSNTEAAGAGEVGIPQLTLFSRLHYGGGAAWVAMVAGPQCRPRDCG